MVARALRAAIDLAEEGQQDTRTYAKRAMFTLAQLAMATETGGIERLLSRLPGARWCLALTGRGPASYWAGHHRAGQGPCCEPQLL